MGRERPNPNQPALFSIDANGNAVAGFTIPSKPDASKPAESEPASNVSVVHQPSETITSTTSTVTTNTTSHANRYGAVGTFASHAADKYD